MSADVRELAMFAENLRRAERGMTEFIKQLAVAEGVYAVGEAKKICTREDIVDTGHLRRSFHTDPAPRIVGTVVRIDVHNSAEYASFVEYGHLMVRRGSGSLMQRRRTAYNKRRYKVGKFVLERAMEKTAATQNARLNRKLNAYLRRIFEGGQP